MKTERPPRNAMDAPLAEVYARLKDRMSEQQFLDRLAREREAFDGLLDDEALALLVLDEEGRNDGAIVTLAQCRGRAEATVRVTIDLVETPRGFEKNGREGRVANCAVSDATGGARLVLWDRDADKAEDGTLTPGAHVTVVNARVKDSRWGLELHASPWSVLEVEGALDPAKKKLLDDVRNDAPPVRAAGAPGALRRVEGALRYRSETRPVREDGALDFECDLDIGTSEGLVRVVLRGEGVRNVQGLAQGARVAATHLRAKVRGAATEWHATEETHVERIG